MQLYPDEQLYYLPNSEEPGAWIYVGEVAGTAYYAGDFVGRDYGKLYVIDYALNELHTLDISSGADRKIDACTPLAGQVWTGASGTADGTLYASSTDGTRSYLYTVDVTTGTSTVVGEITNAPAIIDIAVNGEGEIFGLEIEHDKLVKIDPESAVGSEIGSVGFDADYAQGMDFEEVSGVLYLAAYNVDSGRGELRIADTVGGGTQLVGPFPDGAQVDALAFTPPPVQILQNPGFESGWAAWQSEGAPILSNNSFGGSWSANLSGEECWVWQDFYIPSDVLEVSIGYWLTGISADSDWDNDILCGGLWDLSRQVEYASACFGMTYFYSYPMVWKERIYRLNADEVAAVAGRWVSVGFQLEQDWNPGYHKTSTAYVDDTALFLTRPIYDHFVMLPFLKK